MRKHRELLVGAALLLTFPSFAQVNKVKENMDVVFHNTAKILQAIHYQPQPLNDSFSNRIFKTYFEELDPGRKFFTAKDISKFDKFRLTLDDELEGNKPEFFKKVNELYKERITEAEKLVKDILHKPFDFTTPETFDADNEDALFAGTPSERKERWRKYLKYSTLVQYEEMLMQSKKDSSMDQDPVKLEAKAREKVQKVEERTLANIKKLTSDEESFNLYLNHVINLYDPHSNYFLPVEKREFQESMSGIYYGIGALLQEQQGKVQIAELMIGGPAWKSGLIDKDDIIIKVAQGNEKPVDVEGLPMPEVIKLTRGSKGTSVTITFRKKDGTVKAVSMMRDALQLDDSFVKSAVLGDSEKIGYIYFPKFYTAFGEEKGRSCAADMAKELERLKKENVKGVIIDIRNNGGGSLGEVINMVGLFIKEGPVVQVKSSGDRPEAGIVKNKQPLYDGPLIVLVNELSASASEIFAGAIQDYKRGIIMGNATYGKGTVQRTLTVPESLNKINESNGELGSLHVTLQKYYRITGAATQLKGITPDIYLPGIYDPYKVRERDQPTALSWDTIKPLNYNRFNAAELEQVIHASAPLIQHDSVLNVLKENLQWIGERKNSFTLTLDAYRKERDLLNTRLEKVRALFKTADSIAVNNVPEVEEYIQKQEQFRKDNNKAFLKSLSKDLYLSKAILVMREYIKTKSSS